MKLTEILLLTMSVLTFLSGLAILLGSSREQKRTSVWFFVATTGATVWTVSIALFLSLSDSNQDFAKILVAGIYGGAILMDIGLLFYGGWQYRIGRFFAILFSVLGAFLVGLLIAKPELLYSSIILDNSGNMACLEMGWYYLLYMTYFVLATIILLGELLTQIVRAKSKRQRIGKATFLVGFSITGVLSLIFDILLPLNRYDLIWVGPLAIGCTIVAFYYAILRYRLVNLTIRSLKLLSYVILIAFGAVIYMLLFYLIFTALFKIPNPSTSVIVLNFIMIVIVLLLMPIVSEVNAFIRSLISTQDVDIAYIIRKLNKLAPKNVDLEELAMFLADHLHYEYVGLVVDGQLSGSDKRLDISEKELHEIEKLNNDGKSIWQKPNSESLKETFERLNISAVAELHNANDEEFGQILIGKPRSKGNYSRRDLLQIEMIINLVAAVIDSTKQARR